MSHIPKILDAFSRLFCYPDRHSGQAAELLYVVLQGELPEAASDASKFGGFLEQNELWQVEEVFTRTFDINPACALEVGWHLFGEEYARGQFLVRMREELRKYDLPESVELPDHISHVLAVVAAMPDEDAACFVQACVLPAVEKMRQALQEKETPYRHLVACLSRVLRHVWGEPTASEDAAQPGVNRLGPFQSDPLHAFPVADVGAGCGSMCGGQDELVPLQLDRPLSDERVPSDQIRGRES